MALRLRRLLAEKHFDVVHAHDAHALTAAWLASAHRRTRVVASRRLAYPLHTNPLAQARYRSVSRLLAVSRFVAENALVSGLPAHMVEVVYDGVEVPLLPSAEARQKARHHWSIGENDSLLACVGYLLPEKGQETLLGALPALLSEFPRCRLLLAGDGPCRKRLESLARKLGVERAVHFAGFLEDLASVYTALDIFLFPSLAEPLGTSLLSAMARAVPVVASEGGAVREVVEHGRTGLLVPAGDAAATARAVLRLLREPALATRLGAAARVAVKERFTADRMVEHTLRVHHEVSSSGERP